MKTTNKKQGKRGRKQRSKPTDDFQRLVDAMALTILLMARVTGKTIHQILPTSSGRGKLSEQGN